MAIKRDLSAPLAVSEFDGEKKRKKRVTRTSSDGKTTREVRRKDGSLKKRVTRTESKINIAPGITPRTKKTKDVKKVSRSGNKVIIKNKTKSSASKTKDGKKDGMYPQRTTRSKVTLSNSKGTDDMQLRKVKVVKKAGGSTIEKSKSTGNTGTSAILKTIRNGGGMRGYRKK